MSKINLCEMQAAIASDRLRTWGGEDTEVKENDVER